MRVDTLQTPIGGPAARDWRSLARHARWHRTGNQAALLAFLLIVSVPIILPYFWMVVISFTARSGGVSTDVLWTACAVIVPAVMIYSVVHLMTPVKPVRIVAAVLLALIGAALLALAASVRRKVGLASASGTNAQPTHPKENPAR